MSSQPPIADAEIQHSAAPVTELYSATVVLNRPHFAHPDELHYNHEMNFASAEPIHYPVYADLEPSSR